MLIVQENAKYDLDEIKNSLEIIKEKISAFPVLIELEKRIKLKTKKAMRKPLMKQIRVISDFLNRDAKKFLSRNKL